MTLRTGHLLLVVLLVVTAGCSGIADHREQTDTATPVTVPTQQPTLAPGITTDAVSDADRLAGLNARILNRSAYQLERTVRMEGANGTLRVRRRQRGTSNGVVRSRLSVRGDGPVETAVQNWTRYRESEVVWSRTSLSSGRTVTNRLPPSNATTYFMGRTLPARLLSAGAYEITQSSNGTVVLRSTAPFALDRSVTAVRTGPPRNVSVQATITEGGLIRRLTVDYTTVVGSRAVRIHIDQTVTPLETADIERPEWVSPQ